MKNRLN